MTDLDLLIDLHARNERQGPGGDEETRRAIELARLDTGSPFAVADIGCGAGASALVLARALNTRVTAIDAAEALVQALRRRADASGLGARIDARVGRMEELPFEPDSLDLIWSEGAIYNMGFEAGVRAWRPFLRPGGVIAVTDLTWTTARRPADVEAHWAREYPGIDTAGAKLSLLEQAGYMPLGFFFLPRHCWEANYYAPLQAEFAGFLQRYNHSDQARRIVAAEEAEITLYRDRGQWYGYGFYIARRFDQ